MVLCAPTTWFQVVTGHPCISEQESYDMDGFCFSCLRVWNHTSGTWLDVFHVVVGLICLSRLLFNGGAASERVVRSTRKMHFFRFQFTRIIWTYFDVFLDFCLSYLGHALVSVKSELSSLPALLLCGVFLWNFRDSRGPNGAQWRVEIPYECDWREGALVVFVWARVL